MFRKVLWIVLSVVASSLWAADVPSAGLKEERLQTLKFGIETEILDLVRALQQEKNKEYLPELAATYRRSHNLELRELLLLFYNDLQDNGLENDAIGELRTPEKKPNSLLLTAVSYLTTLKSRSSEDVFVQLMKDKNKTLALASIRALAKIGARGRAGDILKLYQDVETDPNFKPDLIWTLGEMKSFEAVDLLIKEFDDNESDPLLQGAILNALGKIGDARAWDKVAVALTVTNTDLRTAAVQALPSFPGRFELRDALINALRDAQVNVRLAGADAAAALKASDLSELLLFRIKKDPEPRVRAACLRALASFDGGATQVLALLADRKTDFTVWREALNQAIDKKWAGVSDALKKVMEAENKDKNGSLAPVIGNTLLAQRDNYRELFGMLLANDKVSSRQSALRAISAGNFREYESTVRTLAQKDPDAGVKTQAAKILKDWGVSP